MVWEKILGKNPFTMRYLLSPNVALKRAQLSEVAPFPHQPLPAPLEKAKDSTHGPSLSMAKSQNWIPPKAHQLSTAPVSEYNKPKAVPRFNQTEKDTFF